jgi:hypothetical protein
MRGSKALLGLGTKEEGYFLLNDFHTTASTATPSIRFIINRKMFMVYIVLQRILVLFCWGVLLWQIIGNLAVVKTSSFPLLYFIFKAERWERVPPRIDIWELKGKENKSGIVHEAGFQFQNAGIGSLSGS